MYILTFLSSSGKISTLWLQADSDMDAEEVGRNEEKKYNKQLLDIVRA